MSMISEQVKELRTYGEKSIFAPSTRDVFNQAADTIESLSAKLQAANMECQKGNYSIGDLSELIEKFDNEKIKGITDFEQVQIFNALKYLEMYQKVGTIEKFMELKQNMERPAEDCDGWISCSDPPKHANEVLIFNGKSYSVGYYDGKTWVNAIHPVEWQEIRHEP